MFLLGLAYLICLIGIPVTLVGFLIQTARKRPNNKVWGAILIGLVVVFVVCFLVTPSSDSSDSETDTAGEETEFPSAPIPSTTASTEPAQATTASTEATHVQTEAEKFAEENGLSVELAESIEAALAESAHGYKLSQIYEWKQIDDYAYGQRYTGWMSMEYVWVFYVNGDKLESIRQQSGLDFIWSAES